VPLATAASGKGRARVSRAAYRLAWSITTTRMQCMAQWPKRQMVRHTMAPSPSQLCTRRIASCILGHGAHSRRSINQRPAVETRGHGFHRIPFHRHSRYPLYYVCRVVSCSCPTVRHTVPRIRATLSFSPSQHAANTHVQDATALPLEPSSLPVATLRVLPLSHHL
jgi:hypothetical protein